MLDTPDGSHRKRDKQFRRLQGSQIKLPDSNQAGGSIYHQQNVISIPFEPFLRFEHTRIGWRQQIESDKSHSHSYSKSYFPAEQANYLDEEIYRKIQSGAKDVCKAIESKYKSQYEADICCYNASFWIMVSSLVLIFGGIALLVYARGNEVKGFDLPSGLIIFVGIAMFLLLIWFRKFHKSKQQKLLDQMLCDFEVWLNRLNVSRLIETNKENRSDFRFVIKVKMDSDDDDFKQYRIDVIQCE